MGKKTSEKEKSGCFENDPIQSLYSKKLDNLMSKMYTFVEVDENAVNRQPNKIEPAVSFLAASPKAVDHTISFHFLPVTAINQKHTTNNRMRSWKAKPRFFEEITYEDMCSVVVSGDWVLNKKGIYGKGRERRSELITGAVHSSALKKCFNKEL